MPYQIINIKETPGIAEKAIPWFASKWGVSLDEYQKSFDAMFHGSGNLPRWYLILDEQDKILGGCGLVQNDFIDRTDLSPYLCALCIEPEARGRQLGALLLRHVRCDAGKLGFPKLYLCTDHIGYYEKYGWQFIGTGTQHSGELSWIYEASSIQDSFLETMDSFFTARVEGYEHQMLCNVEGCPEGYRQMAELLPQDTGSLLDLGCGTGLEIDEIFKLHPAVQVTGIDLTQSMLDKLKEKYPKKTINLICGSYFDVDLGESKYDAAVSFQTMHHFSHDEKLTLYSRILGSIKPGGYYIEGDYMVEHQEEEDALFQQYHRLRREQGIPEGVFVHFDTPCTVGNQQMLLKKAGFSPVRLITRIGNTTLITAQKPLSGFSPRNQA